MYQGFLIYQKDQHSIKSSGNQLLKANKEIKALQLQSTIKF